MVGAGAGVTCGHAIEWDALEQTRVHRGARCVYPVTQ